MHTDRLLATLCVQVNRATGGKAKLSDFIPVEEQTIAIDDAEAFHAMFWGD